MRAVQAAREVASRLQAAGVPSAQVDAELLVAHVLGVPRSRLVLSDAPDPVALEELVARRIAREPLQHITGSAAFRHIEVQVGPGVFVPRPETELLADLVLPRKPRVAVELCAGSGALSAALADEIPGCQIYAVEMSPLAFGWLQRNVERAVLADVRDALPELNGTVDVVVANPPYLVPGTFLEPEAAADPAMALWGSGPDALDEVRMCIAAACRLLRPEGFFAVEHDVSQADAVVELMADFADVRGHSDLTGRPRCTTGTWTGVLRTLEARPYFSPNLDRPPGGFEKPQQLPVR